MTIMSNIKNNNKTHDEEELSSITTKDEGLSKQSLVNTTATTKATIHKSSSLVDIELGDVDVSTSSYTPHLGRGLSKDRFTICSNGEIGRDSTTTTTYKRNIKQFYKNEYHHHDNNYYDNDDDNDNSSIDTTPSQEELLLSSSNNDNDDEMNDPAASATLPNWLTKPLGDNWIEIIEDDFLNDKEYEELYSSERIINTPPDDCFASVTGGWQQRYLSKRNNNNISKQHQQHQTQALIPKINDLPLYEYIPLAAREIIQQGFNKSLYYTRVGTLEIATKFNLNSFPQTSDLGIVGGYTYNNFFADGRMNMNGRMLSSSSSLFLHRQQQQHLLRRQRSSNIDQNNSVSEQTVATTTTMEDDLSSSFMTTATSTAFGPYCSADSYFDSLMFGTSTTNEEDASECTSILEDYNHNKNSMIDRVKIIEHLPPFSSLSWLDRQLVEEWRTIHNDDLKQLIEIQNILVLKKKKKKKKKRQQYQTQQQQQQQDDKQNRNDNNESIFSPTTNKISENKFPPHNFGSRASSGINTYNKYDEVNDTSSVHKDDNEDEIEEEDDDNVEYTRVRTLIPPPAPRPRWAHLTHCSLCPRPVNTNIRDNPNPPFNTIRRRHHCRLCGTSVCSKHGNYVHPLPQLGYHPSINERVCILCKVLLVKQDWMERQIWKLCRVRDYFNGTLTPYFIPGVDSISDVASRFTTLTLSISRKLPTILMGPQTTLAIETIDLVRKHGLNAVFGFLLRKEFIQASELLMKVIGIDKNKWPISWKEMTLGIFYALAAEKYRRGTRPTHEAYIHRFRLHQPTSSAVTPAPAPTPTPTTSSPISSSLTYSTKVSHSTTKEISNSTTVTDTTSQTFQSNTPLVLPSTTSLSSSSVAATSTFDSSQVRTSISKVMLPPSTVHSFSNEHGINSTQHEEVVTCKKSTSSKSETCNTFADTTKLGSNNILLDDDKKQNGQRKSNLEREQELTKEKEKKTSNKFTNDTSEGIQQGPDKNTITSTLDNTNNEKVVNERTETSTTTKEETSSETSQKDSTLNSRFSTYNQTINDENERANMRETPNRKDDDLTKDPNDNIGMSKSSSNSSIIDTSTSINAKSEGIAYSSNHSRRMSPITTTLNVNENPVLEELVNELLEQAEARAACKVNNNEVFCSDERTISSSRNTGVLKQQKETEQRSNNDDDDDDDDVDNDDNVTQPLQSVSDDSNTKRMGDDEEEKKKNIELLMKENEYSINKGGVCKYVTDETIQDCLWYGPLALEFLYATNEIDLQLLSAQQGWRLLYSHLHPLDNISREMSNGQSSSTTSQQDVGTTSPSRSKRSHGKESHKKNKSNHTDSPHRSNKGRSSTKGEESDTNGIVNDDDDEDGVLDKPAYAVLVHEEEKVVCWGIRGTATLSDIVMDIRAVPVPFPPESSSSPSTTRTTTEDEDDDDDNGADKQNKKLNDCEPWDIVPKPETSSDDNGMALCGMARAATNLFRDNIAVIDEFIQRGYKIRITGHSLGGGVGALLGILVQRYIQRVYFASNENSENKVNSSTSEQNSIQPTDNNNNPSPSTRLSDAGDDGEMLDDTTAKTKPSNINHDQDQQEVLPSPPKLDFKKDDDIVRVYGYGTPSCIDKLLAKESSQFTTTVILHDDVIPRLTSTSIRNLLKYLMLIKQTWVDQHFHKDIQSFMKRAKQVWAPRLRSSFVLSNKNRYKEQDGSASSSSSSSRTGVTLTNDEESTMESKFNATLLMADEAFFASEQSNAEDDGRGGKLHRQHSLLESLDSSDEEDYDDYGAEREGSDTYNFEWTNVSGKLRPTSEEKLVSNQKKGPSKKNSSPSSLYESSSSWSQVPFDEPPLDYYESSSNKIVDEQEEADEFDDNDDDPVMLSETPLPKMYIPGKIIHIYTHKGTYKAAHVPCQFRELRRISLAGNMLSDHTSRAYYEALLEVQNVRCAINECPEWIGFQESSMCSCCASSFTWASTSDSAAQEARDKHNCRSCGQLVCGPCSTNRIALPKYGIQSPVRICDACYYNLGVV